MNGFFIFTESKLLKKYFSVSAKNFCANKKIFKKNKKILFLYYIKTYKKFLY